MVEKNITCSRQTNKIKRHLFQSEVKIRALWAFRESSWLTKSTSNSELTTKKAPISRAAFTAACSWYFMLSRFSCLGNLYIIMCNIKLSIWDFSHVQAQLYMQPFQWLTQCPRSVSVYVPYIFISDCWGKFSTPFHAQRKRYNRSKSKTSQQKKQHLKHPENMY